MFSDLSRIPAYREYTPEQQYTLQSVYPCCSANTVSAGIPVTVYKIHSLIQKTHFKDGLLGCRQNAEAQACQRHLAHGHAGGQRLVVPPARQALVCSVELHCSLLILARAAPHAQDAERVQVARLVAAAASWWVGDAG